VSAKRRAFVLINLSNGVKSGVHIIIDICILWFAFFHWYSKTFHWCVCILSVINARGSLYFSVYSYLVKRKSIHSESVDILGVWWWYLTVCVLK